jgi:hypothetical protein
MINPIFLKMLEHTWRVMQMVLGVVGFWQMSTEFDFCNLLDELDILNA